VSERAFPRRVREVKTGCRVSDLQIAGLRAMFVVVNDENSTARVHQCSSVFTNISFTFFDEGGDDLQ
jgi:hypothetical protein